MGSEENKECLGSMPERICAPETFGATLRKESNDPVLAGRGHCRRKDAAGATVLGRGNLNVGDDIRVATFRVTGVHRSGGIAVRSAVGDCGIRVQSAGIQ